MADTRLVFGGVTFRGLKLPDRIVLPGGARSIHTRHLVGGWERAGHLVANLHSHEPTMGCSRRSV